MFLLDTNIIKTIFCSQQGYILQVCLKNLPFEVHICRVDGAGTRDHSLLEVSFGKWKMYHKSVVLWTYVPQVPQIWYKCGTKHRSSLKHINISKNSEICVDMTHCFVMQVDTGKGVRTTKLYYELFFSQRGYILQL